MDGRPPEAIRGLIFDVNDVLYDGSLWRRWLLQVLARMNVRKRYADFYHEWEHEFYPRACLGEGEYCEVLRHYLANLGLARGQIDEVCRAAGVREKCGDHALRPFRGVERTLAHLHREGFALAALSNTELSELELRGKLADLGLDGYFHVVVSSRDCGAVKPQPQAYAAAMERWHLSATEVAFVGNDSEELQGAAAVGLATIAVFHESHARADWRLDDIEQLCELTVARYLRVA